MLRLEKIRKTRDISVSVRQKTPFFNSIFCIALLWAIAIHLFGLLNFHIAPFKINYNDSIFPPVAVASDLGRVFQGNALAYLDEEIIVPPYLLLPQAAEPPAPQVPEIALARKLELYSPLLNKPHPFLTAEMSCLAHGGCSLEPSSSPAVKIHVSGPLGGFSWIDSRSEVSNLPTLQKKDYHVVFDVLADSRSGRVFWLQPRDKTPLPLLLWCEETLKNMHFQITSFDIATAGKIEIFLRLPLSEKS